MLTATMNRPDPKLPTLVTFMAACLICVVFVFINFTVAAQTQQPTQGADAVSISREVFSWIIAAAGFITLAVGIVYGFLKKQRYENLKTERDELKSLADSREERIKELKHTCNETEARLKLRIAQETQENANLKESNGALVSQTLQMKAVLRDLRLSGKWDGNEDRIHETR